MLIGIHITKKKELKYRANGNKNLESSNGQIKSPD